MKRRNGWPWQDMGIPGPKSNNKYISHGIKYASRNDTNWPDWNYRKEHESYRMKYGSSCQDIAAPYQNYERYPSSYRTKYDSSWDDTTSNHQNNENNYASHIMDYNQSNKRDHATYASSDWNRQKEHVSYRMKYDSSFWDLTASDQQYERPPVSYRMQYDSCRDMSSSGQEYEREHVSHGVKYGSSCQKLFPYSQNHQDLGSYRVKNYSLGESTNASGENYDRKYVSYNKYDSNRSAVKRFRLPFYQMDNLPDAAFKAGPKQHFSKRTFCSFSNNNDKPERSSASHNMHIDKSYENASDKKSVHETTESFPMNSEKFRPSCTEVLKSETKENLEANQHIEMDKLSCTSDVHVETREAASSTCLRNSEKIVKKSCTSGLIPIETRKTVSSACLHNSEKISTDIYSKINQVSNPVQKKQCNYTGLLKELRNIFGTTAESELVMSLATVKRKKRKLSGVKVSEIVDLVERVLLENTSERIGMNGIDKFIGIPWQKVKDKSFVWNNENLDEDCIICQEPILRNKTFLECKHMFHTACIREWCNKNSICPVCRKYTKLMDEFPPLR